MMDKIDITDQIEDMPSERMLLAFSRAARKYGIETEWHGDQLTIDADEEALENDDEFLDLFEQELKTLVAQDSIDRLLDEGLVEVDHIDEDGNVCYRTTEEGARVAAS